MIFVLIWRRLGATTCKKVLAWLAFGTRVWLMAYVVLTIVGSLMATMTGGWILVAHLFFGLV